MPAIFILSYRQPWRIRYLLFLLCYFYLFHLQHKNIEAYEQLAGRIELYGLLQEGMDDLSAGKTRPFSEAMADLRRRRSR